MTNRFKCYILDDEPLALNVIERHLSRFEQFEICGKSTDPVQALGELHQMKPDLLFLDIEMPEIDGIQLLKSMRRPPAVIVTTAYREFAVEGFELNVLDYLVKPIPFNRFMKAIDKFLSTRKVTSPLQSDQVEGAMFVRAERKNIKVSFDDILYVEGVKDYVKIVMEHRVLMSKISIGKMFEKLPKGFVRVHKSFVIAIDKVSSFDHSQIEIGHHLIPLGRRFKEEALRSLRGI